MKLRLNKEEKAALLVAVSKGELDTAKIPRLYKEIRGNNDFLDMLMQLDMEDEEKRLKRAKRVELHRLCPFVVSGSLNKGKILPFQGE